MHCTAFSSVGEATTEEFDRFLQKRVEVVTKKD
jgi:hypothetical protein